MRVRLCLKIGELAGTVALIAILAQIGTQWILLIGSLLVPPFGMYMVVRSPDRQKHLLPYQTYMAVAAGKRWLRVDAALCACMFFAFGGFGLILFASANQSWTNGGRETSNILSLASLMGLATAFLYGLNSIASLSRLRATTIDFSHAMINHAKCQSAHSKVSAAPNGQPPTMLHIDTLDRFHQSPLPFPDDTLGHKPRDADLPSYFQIVVASERLTSQTQSIPRVQSLSKDRSILDNWTRAKQQVAVYDIEHFGINMIHSEGSPEPFQVYDVPADNPSPAVLVRRIGDRFELAPKQGTSLQQRSSVTQINVSVPNSPSAPTAKPTGTTQQPTAPTQQSQHSSLSTTTPVRTTVSASPAPKHQNS